MGGIIQPPISATRIAAAQRPSLNNYGPANPLYIAHRSDGLLYPEGAIESYRRSVASGALTLEIDCWLLADGALGCMHDSTVDRTTSSTGSVQALTSVTFKSLVIDGNNWHGTKYGNGTPPLLPELIAEFRDKAIFFVEAKSAGTTGQKIVDALTTARIPASQALVNSFVLAQLAPAVTAGYPASFNATTGDASERSACLAAGVKSVGLNAYFHSDTIIQDWVAAGFTVIMAGPNRRWERDKFRGLGVWMFYTDDFGYLSSDQPFSNTDAFYQQGWMHGQLATSTNESYVFTAERGVFSSGSKYGFSNVAATEATLQGWGCPIKSILYANNFTLTTDTTFNSVAADDRWGSIFIADGSKYDKAFDPSTGSGQNGFHFLARRNGTLQIYRYNNGTATLLQQVDGSLLALGTSYTHKLTVTPSTISWARLNINGTVAFSISTADLSWRGGYFHFGHSSAAVDFSNVIIQ